MIHIIWQASFFFLEKIKKTILKYCLSIFNFGVSRVDMAPDKSFSTKKYWFFFLKTYFVGTQQKCYTEALLMITHNIYFHEEIRKKKKKQYLDSGYIILFGAMVDEITFSENNLFWSIVQCVVITQVQIMRSFIRWYMFCCFFFLLSCTNTEDIHWDHLGEAIPMGNMF